MASKDNGPLRALVFLALAVVAGSASLVVLYQLITTYQARIDEAKRPEDTVMVIVAARDLYQGVTITEEDLYAVEIPPRYLPEGVFLSPEHVVGRIPRERVLANEFVRADRLADPESGIGLNAVIPRGMRAISINITDGEALSGFLNPGNYVDVLVTLMPDEDNPNAEKKAPETRTMLQAVFVLGVNSRMGKENYEEAQTKRGKQQPSVTLLATAEQAEKLAFAEQEGDITLLLRNDLDVGEIALFGVELDDLRGVKELVAPPKVRRAKTVSAPVAPTSELKICRGGDCSTQKVDEKGVITNPQ